jgi:tetratricopeptide (TPR) repeat protein
VLCSPVAAGRLAVNEEVRLFRTRHPDRPIIPVMIDGKWPDNFPPALRFELDADGSVSDRPVTILGPDLRQAADGKSLGLAKVVASLTGLSADDVYRRAERARRRQNRLRTALGAAILALAVAGGSAYWQSREQKQTLDEIAALVNRYRLVTPAEAAVPGARAGLTQAITAIAEGSAADARYAKALALLKAGSPAEAEPLLKAVADDKARRADKDAKDAAAAYRNLASITAVSEPTRAREYYAEAARLDPSDVTGMLLNGWFQQQAGQLDAAQAAYARVIAMTEPGGADEALIWAQLGTGDIQSERGNLGGALATYQGTEAIADRLAKSGDVDRQRDLSVSLERIGDVQVAQGDLMGALTSYRDSLALRERLAKSDVGNALWQRDRSVSYEKVGDVLREEGDFAGAVASYRQSLAIRDRLSRSDPSNTLWQRDLSVAHNKIGDVQAAQGELAGALTSYRDSLALRDRLAKSDPDNASWQRDLSVSYDRVGDVLKAQGDLAGALTSHREGAAMRERLAKSDPSHAEWQRDLSVSHEKVGE